MPDTLTIRELLQASQTHLLNLDSGRLDCELLLAYVLGRDRNYLYSRPEQPVSPASAADFRSLLAKRASGYPLAYLTGYKEFWSTRLTVNRDALIPRPETELLIEIILELTDKDARLKILDLGTGTGAIAIAVAKERPHSTVTATDISNAALALAMENARANNITNIRFVQSDWFTELGRKQFDIILSNPPYVDSGDPALLAGEIRHEPRIALDGGHGGMDAIHRIVPAAGSHLTNRGWILLEHGYNQGQAVRDILLFCRFRDITTRQDYASHERITFACYP